MPSDFLKYTPVEEKDRSAHGRNNAKPGQRACVMCNNTINQKSLSFEQRLVDDKDFCRECWDKITNAVYPTDNILLHALLLQGRAS